QLALVPGMGDDVGWVIEAATEGAYDVPVGLAVGVRGALVAVRGAQGVQLVRRLQARLGEGHFVQRNRLLGLGVAEAADRRPPRAPATRYAGAAEPLPRWQTREKQAEARPRPPRATSGCRGATTTASRDAAMRGAWEPAGRAQAAPARPRLAAAEVSWPARRA